MVHLFLAAPFPDTARAAQFAAVRASLEADTATESLLLGNLVLEDGAAPLDAVVVRPHGITLLVLVPRGGALGIPALGYGGWQLNGEPLAGGEDFDNPFEQFRQQKATLAAWLRPRFTPAQANLQFISGVVVFEAPLTFGPDVEAALNEAPAGFQLLAGPADLPRRLRQLATPEIDLTAADLAEWAAELNDFAATAPPAPTAAPATGLAADTPEAVAAAAGSFLGGKARALWGWLGANDVPDDDVPYGAAAALMASNEEKKHLEQLRQQMQADVQAQLQALETREAERERSIAQLRAELAQAPPVAAEATALVSRLGAETREKAALEAEMEASKAELAARNQELDAKIQQLSQLIGQLSAVPVAPTPAAPAPAPAREAAAEAPEPTATAAAASPVAAIAPPVAPAVVEAFATPLAAAPTIPETTAAAPAPAVATKQDQPVPAAATSSAPLAAPAPNRAVALEALFPTPVAAATPAAPVAASAPTSGRSAANPAEPAATSAEQPATGAPTAPPVAEHLRAFGARAQAAGAAAVPHLQKLAAAARARPRVLLGAAGAVVLLLVVWLFSHRTSIAPVPYQENGRWGYANASGEPVIKAQFASAAPFEGGQAVVEKDGAFGLVDEAGKQVVGAAYDAINPYRGGYARVRVGEAYTFLEEGGQEFDHYFFNALDFAEGHAAVLDHRGWFYINGPEVPEKPVIFKEAYSFVDGLARVRLPDGYTFITPDYLADPASGTKPFGRYQLAADFSNGKARVTQNGRSFLIDKDGEEVK
ncbi:WG repeat-containing protein [Hymenobacter sp. DH14]|uniref:WG repeat-containing protein n=1 Tax=Hymenobacter cyanobacteriorum TaxID=2926463 RepID=A0A9X1VEN1_9BACT|nr:WG repeat-containing protein [Hymenobacter cyanobacteriorum]MCI1187155.1 WG repeat-containing protein [Hymenobacter cyanobacteriorum]